MTTARERKTMEYTAILEEISIGSTVENLRFSRTVPMGGGFACADQGKPFEYPKPWTLEEMQAPLDQPWVIREYAVPAMMIWKPMADEAEREKDGWLELTTLRRYIARGRLQTVWFRAL